jgi:Tfp pilus assembly protein FimV
MVVSIPKTVITGAAAQLQHPQMTLPLVSESRPTAHYGRIAGNQNKIHKIKGGRPTYFGTLMPPRHHHAQQQQQHQLRQMQAQMQDLFRAMQSMNQGLNQPGLNQATASSGYSTNTYVTPPPPTPPRPLPPHPLCTIIVL